MAEVIFEFLWEGYKPDQRQYRNQSIELMPLGKEGTSVLIAVPVPLEHELIYNSEAIIQAQLAGNKADDPILTMQGMKYVIDKFDALFSEKEKEATKTDDEDWMEEDTKPAAEKKSATKAEEEDWENDTKKPDEVPWDEDTENWQ